MWPRLSAGSVVIELAVVWWQNSKKEDCHGEVKAVDAATEN